MLWGVVTVSFFESWILPVPLEAILIPLMQMRRDKLWLICFMALLGCLVGATFGYLLGFFLFDWIGQFVIEHFSSPQQFDAVQTAMQDQGFWFVFSVGVTPIPFQMAMLAAGVTGYALGLYLLAALLARGIRYFGLGLLVWLFGNQAQRLFEHHKMQAMVVMLILIAILWGLIWWLN